jgi:hypothetical protein
MKTYQKVKQIEPNAYAHRVITDDDLCFWFIYVQRGIQRVTLGESAHRESWAWADALRNIPAQKGKP